MAKTKTVSSPDRPTSSSVLTQKDANRYRIVLSKYAKANTSSKGVAQDTLKSLGIYTAQGKISKNYR